MAKKGFFEDIIETALTNRALYDIAEKSKGPNGKVDRWKAAAMARNLGHTSWGEMATLADKMDIIDSHSTSTFIRNEMMNDPDLYSDIDDWRDNYSDECGLDPYDYDSEEEYMDELEMTSMEWYESVPNDHGIDPKDYFSFEEYQEAVMEAEEEDQGHCKLEVSEEVLSEDNEYNTVISVKEREYPNKRQQEAAIYYDGKDFNLDDDEEMDYEKRAAFILNYSDKIIAANYLTVDGHYLYSQAVKDNFELPITLPDEDEHSEYNLDKILLKIYTRDKDLSFKVWSWVLQQFTPYIKYGNDTGFFISDIVIYNVYSFPDNYLNDLINYMEQNPEFQKLLVEASDILSSDYSKLIYVAITEGKYTIASYIFDYKLKVGGDDWRSINDFIQETIDCCSNGEEVESIEYFRDHLFPLVKQINNGMVFDEIDRWEEEIEKYIDEVVSEAEKYAYSRKNEWRKTVPDGSKYGLDPTLYDSKDEYLEDLNYYKYRWRRTYEKWDTLGLNVNDFETSQEFKAAYYAKKKAMDEYCSSSVANDDSDKTIYSICGVVFSNNSRPYTYRTDGISVKVNDRVRVMVRDVERIGIVVSVGECLRAGAPYPIDQMKSILGVVSEENE